jgi:ATP phosphoribosyltransferase regulatory subunit
MRNWLLPEYIEDVLPAEAARLETLRRSLLDLFKVNGYQYVIPPMLEYMESLTTGAGHDLDIATYKVVDQLSGRLMGVRADMTPQAARIDAHLLNQQGITRLCYAGSVLKTQPEGLSQTREPLQVGAEVYGHAGTASDIEIQRLLVKALQAIGVKDITIDLCHVNVFGSLIKSAGVSAEVEYDLYAAMRSKDQTTVAALAQGVEDGIKQALIDLTTLHGNESVLAKAHALLPKTESITAALNELKIVSDALSELGVSTSFDLSDLRGYHYHSGIVFAAYAQGFKGPLALGGRYDEVGVAFGRARPATGFSIDLRGIVYGLAPAEVEFGILAPAFESADKETHASLTLKIEKLRGEGVVVIQTLADSISDANEMHCDRKLEHYNSGWHVVDI